jgi:hypothetical protein
LLLFEELFEEPLLLEFELELPLLFEELLLLEFELELLLLLEELLDELFEELLLLELALLLEEPLEELFDDELDERLDELLTELLLERLPLARAPSAAGKPTAPAARLTPRSHAPKNAWTGLMAWLLFELELLLLLDEPFEELLEELFDERLLEVLLEVLLLRLLAKPRPSSACAVALLPCAVCATAAVLAPTPSVKPAMAAAMSLSLLFIRYS